MQRLYDLCTLCYKYWNFVKISRYASIMNFIAIVLNLMGLNHTQYFINIFLCFNVCV